MMVAMRENRKKQRSRNDKYDAKIDEGRATMGRLLTVPVPARAQPPGTLYPISHGKQLVLGKGKRQKKMSIWCWDYCHYDVRAEQQQQR